MISVIVGYRNRELERVKRSIESLAAQSHTNFELIFVDYGSDLEIASSIKNFISTHSFAKYIYIDTRGMFWNRAHALNIGVTYANCEILVFLDVDLILEQEFLDKIVKLNYESFYYTFTCFYLPEKFDFSYDLLKNGIHYEQNYVGLCALLRSSFIDIGGLDDYYLIWGVEDDDLYMRLTKSGLQRDHLNAIDYKLFHQWHKSESPKYPSFWYLEMVDFYSKKKYNIFQEEKKNKLNLSFPSRPLLNDKNHIHFDLNIQIRYSSDFLVYNKLIEAIHDSSIHSINFYYEGYIEKYAQYNKLYRFIFDRNETMYQKKYIISQNDVELFLQYLVAKNRYLIFDYLIESQQNNLRLYIIKK